jgi:hypothetical protein
LYRAAVVTALVQDRVGSRMSAVSEGPASEEFDQFDLSKMTAREVAAELVRRSQPRPIDSSPTATSSSDDPTAGATTSAPQPASPSAAPLPAFLSAPLSSSPDQAAEHVSDTAAKTLGLEKASALDWPMTDARAECGGRDPLDTLSRALHNHLQERASSEDDTARRAAGASPSVSSSSPPAAPLSQAPAASATPQPASTWTPARAAETWPSSATPRSTESLDIPAAPSSIGRTAENDLPLGLLLGGFARISAVADRPVGTGRAAGTGPLLAGRSVATERMQRAAAADSVPAERAAPDLAGPDLTAPDLTAPDLTVPDLADSDIPLIPSRPAIRRFRSEDRLLERAKAIIARRMAALSARLSSRASAGASAAAVQWRRVPQWRQMRGHKISWHPVNWRALNWHPVNWRAVNWRAVHWEAVASGVLIGILLTIAPAIYLLTAPHHTVVPASTLQATDAAPVAGVTPSPETSTTTPPAGPTADSLATPAPSPPTIVPPDPPSLVTAAGGTTATTESTTSAATTPAATTPAATTPAATTSEQVATATGKDASTTTPPATKPAAVKSTSSKKQKQKAGTVSVHQAPRPATDQLSPAKR